MLGEVVVLVPVLNRPKNVVPLIESFAESGTPGSLLFIVTEGDEREDTALRLAHGDVHQSFWDDWKFQVLQVPPTCISWPQKINAGFAKTSEPWLLLAADDVRFHPGWFQATERLRDRHNYGVIGTNDLGNPRVLAGQHSTHPLVSRIYIETHGGTLDGPGSVLYEGYRHSYSDDELIATAQARGAYAHCMSAIVEHLHPLWQKAKWDDVYELGQRAAEMDRATWIARSERLLRAQMVAH